MTDADYEDALAYIAYIADRAAHIPVRAQVDGQWVTSFLDELPEGERSRHIERLARRRLASRRNGGVHG